MPVPTHPQQLVCTFLVPVSTPTQLLVCTFLVPVPTPPQSVRSSESLASDHGTTLRVNLPSVSDLRDAEYYAQPGVSRSVEERITTVSFLKRFFFNSLCFFLVFKFNLCDCHEK